MTLTLTPQTIAELVLSAARSEPGHLDCFASVGVGSSVNLRWAANSLTTNGYGWETDLSITAIVTAPGGIRTGFVSLTADNLTLDEIKKVVSKVYAEARASQPVEDAHQIKTDVKIGDWDAPALRTSATVFTDTSAALGELFAAARSDKFLHYGYAEHSIGTTWFASAGGMRIRVDGPDGRIEMTSKSSDGLRSTWEGKHTTTFTDLDLFALDSKMRTRLEWQNRKIEVPVGKYATILPPGAVADLMTTFSSALGNRDAHEGRSAFSSRPGSTHHDGLAGTTRIGQRISSLPFSIYSDPFYPGIEDPDVVLSLLSHDDASLFDSGDRVTRTEWVHDGYLKALVNSRYSASLNGATYTPDCANLIMELPGASGTTEDLVTKLDSGLLLNCLWYIRDINPVDLSVTGLTRDGVYVVESGEVVGCASNFRFNESVGDLLTRVRAAGATEIAQPRENAEYVTQVAMPPLLVEGFNLASLSDAS